MIYLQAIILIDDPITSKVEMIQQNNEHTIGFILFIVRYIYILSSNKFA